MAKISSHIWLGNAIVPSEQAQLHIATSAVLYGLSVYTVFPITQTSHGFYVFQLDEHLKRLQNSAKLIGIECPQICQDRWAFLAMIQSLLKSNETDWDKIFIRATIHVDELVPGTRSRGLHTTLSAFLYEASPIVPQNGMRLKTSVWRRNPDFSLPSRAKVNGAYVNSVLAKQDAIDSGYDDAIFLDMDGHVCEISAANIFLVRWNTLITPDVSSDILEGINRKTLIEIVQSEGKQVIERKVDLSELYIADEVFVCGTSAFVAGVTEIDKRYISWGKVWPTTTRLRDRLEQIQMTNDSLSEKYMTKIL